MTAIAEPAAPPSSPPPRPKLNLDGPHCGLRDDVLNGWFRWDTGEMVTGFPIDATDTFVDVGCGDGGACLFAAARGAEVIATDVNSTKIEAIAKSLEASAARSFRAIVSDTNPLPLGDQSATRILATEVLEHVEDPNQFVAELFRIGKPGALYLIAVPDERSEANYKRFAPPCYWQQPNHVRVFSRPAFDRLIVEGGLTIEKKFYKSFFWAMWWSLCWASDHEFGAPENPLLQNWTLTWHHLMNAPKGRAVREALDEVMPKSQVLIARKP